ncbi:hypothetical protein E2C01_076422 [Portunus trituberculatus]|uniref:Uncharacterized protein n=1 Tax=Portunus trituberculatus TaxID=210409 RepID=A0A5B7IJQ9_PORTR|nr:hypothetical protein [Portunus trituberculatus]
MERQMLKKISLLKLKDSTAITTTTTTKPAAPLNGEIEDQITELDTKGAFCISEAVKMGVTGTCIEDMTGVWCTRVGDTWKRRYRKAKGEVGGEC